MTQLLASKKSLIEECVDSLQNELLLREDSFYSTVRATARLIDLSPSTLLDSHLLKNGAPSGVLHKLFRCSVEDLPETLKPLHGFDYRKCEALKTPNGVMRLLPEFVIVGLIRHYATDARHKRARAQALLSAFDSIGIRIFFQEIYTRSRPLESSFETQDSVIHPVEIVSTTSQEVSPVERLHSLLDRLQQLDLSSRDLTSLVRRNLL